MKIARYVVDDEPSYGVVMSEDGEPTWIAEVGGDPLFSKVTATGRRHELADVRLLAPVIPRSKVVGIGDNYAQSAEARRESGAALSDPPMFLMPNTAVCGPDDPVVMPTWSSDVHFEGELAVVIGRMCKDVTAEQAAGVVFGYTCANDVTARDHLVGGPWARAKGADGFCPLGPWIETELDPADVEIRTRVDGQTRQEDSTALLLRPVADLVAAVSRVFTLLPGDVIITGSPAGAGRVEEGQRVEVEIEGIGTLGNPFVRR